MHQNNKMTLHSSTLKPPCGMLKVSLLCYKKFASDVKQTGHIMCPHDACAANKIINNKQYKLPWHTDDANPAHVSPKVNDEFAIWCEEKYGSDDLGHVAVTRGKRHDYLAMALNYSKSKHSCLDFYNSRTTFLC